MKLLLLMNSILVSACGAYSDNPPETTGKQVYPVEQSAPEPEKSLAPYIELFYERAAENGKENLTRLPVVFEDLPEGVAGACNSLVYADGHIEYVDVMIDEGEWNKYTEYQRIALIAHELGHCVLGRAHVPATAKSFMIDTILDEYFYFYYYEDLWLELFTGLGSQSANSRMYHPHHTGTLLDTSNKDFQEPGE